MRGGTRRTGEIQQNRRISIHPPRAGRDEILDKQGVDALLFQSTRPVRGGTQVRGVGAGLNLVISIHPPRAGRDNFQPLHHIH